MIEFIGEGAGISTADMNRRIRTLMRREHDRLGKLFGVNAVAMPDAYEVQVKVAMGDAPQATGRVYITTVGPASNGERAGAMYMEISAGGKVVGRFGGFGKTDGSYEDGVKVLSGGRPLGESKDSAVDTSRIDWLNVGREVHGGDHKRMEAAIATMDWVDSAPNMRLPMSQGEAIKALMKEFKINRITALSYDGASFHTPGAHAEDGNWHVLGIEVPYKNGARRIYFGDCGTHLVPICTIPLTV